MHKPEMFRTPYVAMRHVPYVFGDGTKGTVASGGVLSRGQTVWTEDDYEPRRVQRTTKVFVEGLGIVSLEGRWLVRADVLEHAN
jgi:hypothetical protein